MKSRDNDSSMIIRFYCRNANGNALLLCFSLVVTRCMLSIKSKYDLRQIVVSELRLVLYQNISYGNQSRHFKR